MWTAFGLLIIVVVVAVALYVQKTNKIKISSVTASYIHSDLGSRLKSYGN